MVVKLVATVSAAVAVIAGAILTGTLGRVSASAPGLAQTDGCLAYQPNLPTPAHFVAVIDNPYYPLPLGRTLVYRGTKDGRSQTDRVTVTSKTKVIEGITATTIRDVARHGGSLLEKTKDWYAQDDQGNVWYLGEATSSYEPGGKVDTSGSWTAGVDGGKAGLIMEADPHVPDAYRQECLKGEAEDAAWIVARGGPTTVPYGRVHRVLRSLEFSRLEPKVVDQKIYAPGFGIVLERSMAGPNEVAELVRVRG